MGREGAEHRPARVGLLRLSGAQAEELHSKQGRANQQPGAQRQPSVILRKFDRGLRLWDIAKQYRTTCADILSANQVESEQTIPTDKLLLIPRRKA